MTGPTPYAHPARWYDTIYAAQGKDYAAEAEIVDAFVRARHPDPRSLPGRYCSRLSRLCEVARDAPGSLLMTYEDMADGTGLKGLRGHLGLGHFSNAFRADGVPGLRDSRPLAGCRVRYAKCLEYLRARCVPARS